jgi:monoterpene epsilon-lactone hydrolase
MRQRNLQSLRRVAFHAELARTSAFTLGRRALRGPRHPNWSLPFEVAMAIVRATLQRDHERAAQAVRTRVHPLSRSLLRRVAVHHEQMAGVPVEVHTPHGYRSHDPTLLYLHGGGYVTCSPASHRELIARMALASAARCVAPDYRLAPEHPFPAALEDVIAVYRTLLASGVAPGELFIGGDSAGGGLALAGMLRLRELGEPLPRAAVLLSPWVDLTLNTEDLEGHGPHDYLNARMLVETAPKYAGREPLSHPLVSPIYADLAGLPPLLVQTGEWELFHEQNERLVARARSAGVDVRHEVEPGMLHVFPAFAGVLPQGRAALRSLGQYVRSFTPRPLRRHSSFAPPPR